MHSPAFVKGSLLFFFFFLMRSLRERAAPRRLNRRTTILRGIVCFSLPSRVQEWKVRAGRCYVPRSAKGQRAGATYPTRGSELTERTPWARRCGRRTSDADRRRSTSTYETTTCRGGYGRGVLIGVDASPLSRWRRNGRRHLSES